MQLSFIVKHDSIIWKAYENPLLELRDSIPVALKLEGGLKSLMPSHFVLMEHIARIIMFYVGNTCS